MPYAICNELFEDWPLDKTAAFVAELGYQGLELAPFTLCNLVTDLSAADRRRIRRTVESAGLSVVGLHWLLAQTEGFQLNDSDPDVRARTAQYLLDLIDCCAELGGEVLIFGSPQQRDRAARPLARRGLEIDRRNHARLRCARPAAGRPLLHRTAQPQRNQLYRQCRRSR